MDFNVLNDMQMEAVNKLEGPLLIIAGAGSGKTKTMTYRIANLIEHAVPAYNILALTFTNKAAKEMQERIAALIGAKASEAWIGTFHSICVRILRRDIEKLGYSRSFTIYDDDDQSKVIKDILKRFDLDEKLYSHREIKAIISDAKNRFLTPDEWFAQSSKTFREQKIHGVFVEYVNNLQSSNGLDFDDLIVKTLTLFDEFEEVRKYYQNRFKYVHVDEYQDTNRAQYLLVKTIAEKYRNICVVGDDDQSIYGWRGADIRNILDFEDDYPEAAIIKLEQNYRSTETILSAANELIANNTQRRDKKLWTNGNVGEKIRLYKARDERSESAWLCERISELRRDKQVRLSDICVLYRTHAQSRIIEEMLMRSGIPYKVFGGTRFYDRKEIKDAIAYLRLMVNSSDDVALKRIINIPKRSIGETTISNLDALAHEMNCSIYSLIAELPDGFNSRTQKCIEGFYEILLDLQEKKQNLSLSEFVEYLIETTGLVKQYENTMDEKAIERKENMLEFIGAVKEFENLSDEKTLEAYLENVSLISDLDMADESAEYVTLMTLHSAKGLEYDAVFILGLEEGIFPSMRTINEDPLAEEERRLCYVGITRAKKYLFLAYAKQRMMFNRISNNAESRFIKEIPSKYLLDRLSKHDSSFENEPSKTIKQSVNIGGININGVIKGFVPSISMGIKSNKAPQIFNIGDKVLHKHFGEGYVKELIGIGSTAKIIITFTAYGEKQFALSIAPIVKIG